MYSLNYIKIKNIYNCFIKINNNKKNYKLHISFMIKE